LEVFEAFPGMYRFRHLPGFALFVLNHHLEDFVREQLQLGYKMNLPLLSTLARSFSQEELVKISMQTAPQYLEYLANDKGEQQIADQMEKWLEDQLDLIGKFEIVGQDITVINYVREQAFRKFIPLYTSDMKVALELGSEIDLFMLGAVTSATDVYVNMLKEKLLDETNLSSKVIQASPAITFVYDLVNNKEVLVSGKVNEVMGYTREELLSMGGNVISKLAHPDDLPIIDASIKTLVDRNNDQMQPFEYRFRHKDGSYKWLRTYEVIFKRSNNGLPVQLLGKTFEITNEKETALALERRENQLLEAQAIAHIGSYEWNVKEHVSTNTPEVFRIFEMDRDERYEQFMSYVHPEDLQRVKDAIARSFQSGRYECEYRYLKNGKQKVVWSLGKVEFENGAPVKMIGTVQDITEIRGMENELLNKTRQLERSNESLQQFAFVASHDLKEPLRKINMFTDMVIEKEQERLSPASRANLQKVQSASASMRRMVEDILSFSLLESTKEKGRHSLQAILNEVTELLDQTIQEKGARIIAAPLPEACVTASEFRQLFQNLISNALKFAKKDVPPVITIDHCWISDTEFGDLKPARRYLQLTFRDNGIGFSKEFNERVFELFKRLHPKAEYEGSGLGLAIAKKIVENHEGMMTADSKENVGTTFIIVIPQFD
jgi:PAS domain S-box-containing protein